MTCRSCAPIFSKTKGVSDSPISSWSRCCVSLRRKVFDSSLICLTVCSILCNRRRLLRWLNVSRDELMIFHLLSRFSMTKRRRGISLDSARAIISWRRGCFLEAQLSALSKHAKARLPMMSSSYLPFPMLTNKPATPDFP